MIRPDAIITVLFAAVLPAFLILPWIVAIEGSQVSLSGLDLAFGQYDARPLEYYALASVAIACVGAVVPNIMPRHKTITRACLAVAGVGAMLLMQMQTPMELEGIEWGVGYWIAVSLFVLTAFYAVYVLGAVNERRRRRRRS